MPDEHSRHRADFFGQFAPELLGTQYGKEIWALYQSGKLEPDSVLSSGVFKEDETLANIGEVLQVIDAAREAEEKRQARKAAANATAIEPESL